MRGLVPASATASVRGFWGLPGRWIHVFGGGGNSGEIISLKHTHLSDISPETAKRYLDEAVTNYQPGTKVSDVPSNGPVGPHGADLRNRLLAGELILQVPSQHTPIPQAILDYAESRVPPEDLQGTGELTMATADAVTYRDWYGMYGEPRPEPVYGRRRLAAGGTRSRRELRFQARTEAIRPRAATGMPATPSSDVDSWNPNSSPRCPSRP